MTTRSGRQYRPFILLKVEESKFLQRPVLEIVVDNLS